MLYKHSVVGLYTYFKYTKMGVTLPVLKNEIIDFFFARLGTGRTFTVPSRYNAYTYLYKKYLGNTLFPRYYITPHSSLKWMNNAALEEATNRGVLVNTSQVGNF